MTARSRAPVLYIPHGGGPLPLLGDPGHRELVEFLGAVTGTFARPRAVLVVSAHWEAPVFTVQDIPAPELLYDYYGFPPESYQIRYEVPGAPDVAERIASLLRAADLGVAVDRQRASDHGVFVPMKLLYPDASIPCLQLSLREDLDPAAHIALGRALAPLSADNVLILGSGSSFHNMTAFHDGAVGLERCQEFDDWLFETVCKGDDSMVQKALIDWQNAPQARYAHPREEHLLPLHVCFGAAMAPQMRPERVFNGHMMGYRMSSFLWH